MCEKCGDNNKELGNIQGQVPEYICGVYCHRYTYCQRGMVNLLKDNGGEFTSPCGLKVKVTVDRVHAKEVNQENV